MEKHLFVRYITRCEIPDPSLTAPARQPEQIVSFLRQNYYDKEDNRWRESAIALYLLSGNRIGGYEVLSVGGCESCTLDKRIVLRTAIEVMATGVILVHNHPSGSPLPGQRDIHETENLQRALRAVDISLTDAIIIGEKEFFSFAKEQRLALPE